MEKDEKVEAISNLIWLLVVAVYEKPENAENFTTEINKMHEDKEYIPDKMIEMPGKRPEAEEALRTIMGRMLGRRI